MTRYLYYEDAYTRAFDATVTAVDNTSPLRVALDATAFYPGGGGQPNDQGWLTIPRPEGGNRYRVSAVKKEGDQIWLGTSGLVEEIHAKGNGGCDDEADDTRRDVLNHGRLVSYQ